MKRLDRETPETSETEQVKTNCRYQMKTNSKLHVIAIAICMFLGVLFVLLLTCNSCSSSIRKKNVKETTSKGKQITMSSSSSYSELTRVSKLSLGSSVTYCEWGVANIDRRKKTIIDVPSPSDFETILFGVVIVSDLDSQNMFDKYEWKKTPQDLSTKSPKELRTGFSTYNFKELFDLTTSLIPSFSETDRVLWYSYTLQQELLLNSRYSDGIVWFDVNNNTFFFCLKRL